MTVQNLICFRLLTEYHSFLFLYFYFWLSNEEVSVSLRGIIHSYLIYLPSLLPPFFLCFRLLMEYHSFLFRLVILIVLVIILSFRLLMEYHSFLCTRRRYRLYSFSSFRLLMEYHSFLSYGQKSLLLQYVFRVLSCDIFIFEIFLFISVKSIFNSSFFIYRLTNIFFITLEFLLVYVTY